MARDTPKKLSCLSVSHGACVAPVVVLLGAFCVVSEQHLFGDTGTFPFSPSLSFVDPALGRRCHVLLSEKGRTMEGPRHQHLHQEWQEPLEELVLTNISITFRENRE